MRALTQEELPMVGAAGPLGDTMIDAGGQMQDRGRDLAIIAAGAPPQVRGPLLSGAGYLMLGGAVVSGIGHVANRVEDREGNGPSNPNGSQPAPRPSAPGPLNECKGGYSSGESNGNDRMTVTYHSC